mmetsp:Transcript_9593/g.15711  ORF Transcript_9593/g.15711 Transcript_9593/m.15711 type:complete len:283 (-) Transcript_9593:75-923(-)|eukprot:CAMPEP_0203795146 /NCGR_PEP_ID=MMETSP0100_2-20121128/7027_1 /ASSEMBLY_ACC=CAM_ASM_000210 /TAXON_ID=96639 /ORGANISM=" , Strain NY0313808BC1" /LENGTH=282 /DNA_ID=CAMNT_0050699541 /DNA_START=338 /DNA_END=1186 /DNA_ORIENTATION=+
MGTTQSAEETGAGGETTCEASIDDRTADSSEAQEDETGGFFAECMGYRAKDGCVGAARKIENRKHSGSDMGGETTQGSVKTNLQQIYENQNNTGDQVQTRREMSLSNASGISADSEYKEEIERLTDLEAEKDREIAELKKQLLLLKQKQSSRTLYMEKGKLERHDSIRRRDFEISNLKKDLCLSQLRASTAIRTARNALESDDVWGSTRYLSSHDSEVPESESKGGEGFSGREGKSVDDETTVEKKTRRKSLNMVSALDRQLVDNTLSLDEYALALSTLAEE